MKNQRKRIPLLLTAVIVAATFASISLLGQSTKPSSSDGVMTAKQKEHSKLYKEYRFDKKLREVAELSSGTEVSVIRGGPEKTFEPGQPAFDLHRFLQVMACDSDAIVVGEVKNQSSQLTEDEDFVFTDYDISVERVLKDNPLSPIQVTTVLTISRPGGVIELNHKKVRALDESLQPLSIGHRYLVFLKYIPSTSSYTAFRSDGSFQVTNNKIIKLTKQSLPSELETGNDAESLISEIRNATALPCYE